VLPVVWVLVKEVQRNLLSIHFYLWKAHIIVDFRFLDIDLEMSRLSCEKDAGFIDYSGKKLTGLYLFEEGVGRTVAASVKVEDVADR
jgi:hypothetical protein